MTTTIKKIETCSICGKTSEHTGVGSTNAFGKMDLDTRPPEMERSTLYMRIQTCPSCGYCAPSISKKIDKASDVVNIDSYQRILKNPESPQLANAFLCDSLIQGYLGKYALAAWASVRAAWVCDDHESTICAKIFRDRAVILFKEARVNNQKFASQIGEEEALLADLLRRSDQFKEALEICDEGLNKNPDEYIIKILKLEKTLIGKSDDTCHQVPSDYSGLEYWNKYWDNKYDYILNRLKAE
ncbi:MAG: hypothetical protein WC877_09005 [Dehalococcoidales bacterium]|jgi:tetratricopeptide (TPR) repeat protein